jgi:hypothetical protein
MFVLAMLLALYFLPTIVASHRGHPTGGVLILNALFGWTGIGWIAMLLWAVIAEPPYYFVPGYPYGAWRRY